MDRKAMIYDIVEYETKNDDNNEKKRLQVLISLQTPKLGARLPDDLQQIGSITKWINPLRISQKNALIVALRVIIGDNVHFANNLYIFYFN